MQSCQKVQCCSMINPDEHWIISLQYIAGSSATSADFGDWAFPAGQEDHLLHPELAQFQIRTQTALPRPAMLQHACCTWVIGTLLKAAL